MGANQPRGAVLQFPLLAAQQDLMIIVQPALPECRGEEAGQKYGCPRMGAAMLKPNHLR